MLNIFSPFDSQQARPPMPETRRTPAWYERPQTERPILEVVNPFSQVTLYEQGPPSLDLEGQLRALRQHYTIVDKSDLVMELLRTERTLYALLLEATIPLQRAFGEGRITKLRVQVSDEESLLRVAVQLPKDFSGDPEEALEAFDANWWLENCSRSLGALVFDYEILDAVSMA
jgi:hypothetical protein